MAEVTLKNVVKQFGASRVVDDLSIAIHDASSPSWWVRLAAARPRRCA